VAVEQDAGVTLPELQLAARNHGMPMEALGHDLTPAGLHYLLIHYDIPRVDPAAFRLEIGGAVERPRTLTLAELEALPVERQAVTLECAGNGRALLQPRAISQPWLRDAVGNAEWEGPRVAPLLNAAGVADDAVEVVFEGIDEGVEGGVRQRYARSLTLDEVRAAGVFLALRMNGAPLPAQHGFPLRLVVPGWYGMTHVKWLARIEVVREPFMGYQQATAYRFRRDEDDPGEPLSRMLPRSLIRPPGVPDFMTRMRHVTAGPCVLDGRAWSGWAPISRVEVSVDGGERWRDAALDPPREGSPYAWRRWQVDWLAEPGEHDLCVRATDADGRVQPLEPEWNVGGYVNNAVQRVQVVVSP
jgi:DMSO/TMAO reductase YedYZ molybdopterin-dependent catalytic subunit